MEIAEYVRKASMVFSASVTVIIASQWFAF
jgi:hypothetical protein